ncbi:MAG: prolipoprotein diacylglyceryl transferase [Candidatus Marinimicrobia bacterium]|nr:prolipoprotein diacylglyceryl transferase [Candidatus Neomarinimicrobiota bacterium]
MHPELLHIGPLTIYTYGFMMATAFLVCYLILKQEIKKRGDDPEIASNIIFWGAIGGIVGAKVFYMLEFFQDFLQDPLGMIFSGAGLVFHGGLIGGTITVILVIRHAKKSVGEYANIIGPVLLIGQGIGRIGCFFAGCCHGEACNLPWAVVFPYASPPANYPVHPTQLYETVINFTLFFILVKFVRPRFNKPWQTFSIYLMLAGAERFFIEFIRVNPRVAWGLSSAQFTSMGIFIAGLLMAFIVSKNSSIPFFSKRSTKNK